MQTIITCQPPQRAWHQVFGPATESASLAMRAWTNGQIMLSLSGVQELPLEEVSASLGLGDAMSILVLLDVVGAFGGQLILQFDEDSAGQLVSCLLNREIDASQPWDKLEISALAETGNILASAYLNRITQLIGRRVMPSPPNVVQDFAAGVLESAIVSQAMSCEQVLLCRTQFQLHGEPIPWNVFFVPSLELLQRLRERAESAVS